MLPVILLAAALASPAPPPGQVRLWSRPAPMTMSDWIWGPGGAVAAPRPPFRFLRENFGGTNPKIEVRDARGALWIVKFGGEVHTDVFAARLLPALGYLAEPAYFVPAGRLQGVRGLRRARSFVARDGAFRSARFKLRDPGALSYADQFSWSWTANPFLGSRELNGLKVLVMLLSNWDTKDARDGDGSNTAVFALPAAGAAPRYWYSFTDWGASLGSWGGFLHRDRWDPAAYRRQSRRFVRGVYRGEVLWGYRGKHGRDITRGITPEDLAWLAPWLARITGPQLYAGLLASGATPASAERFTRAILSRIAQLQRVAALAPEH